MVEEAKVGLETYKDDDEWTQRILHPILASVIWNEFLQRMTYL